MVTLHPLDWRPDTLFGGFRGFVGDHSYRYVTHDYGGAKYGIHNFPSIEAAKAQAEADHRTYILNALAESD